MASYFNVINLENYLKNDKNPSNFSFDINSITIFIMENYKQLLLFILMFIIIYIVEHITYYNAIFYGITSSMPLTNQQHTQIKSNSEKKNRKTKK
jgi:hypothetical protein